VGDVSRARLALLRWRARGDLRSGRGVRIARGARVAVARGARVELGDGSALGPDSRIEASGGRVTLGPGARLGERAIVTALAGVDIGPRAVVGDWAVVADAEPTAADVETPLRDQLLRAAPVTIGADAVLGPHAVVGPGARIPARRQVAAYAVVPAPASES
jgi:acetyltransferase-like isoleucine patch superfamily enzyme